jgi:4-hydroxy-tetrahydrodipicolinate synthase
MAGGPVRLPLDELDEKKTEQLKKILATIPKKGTAPLTASKKKAPAAIKKLKAGKNQTPSKLRTR